MIVNCLDTAEKVLEKIDRENQLKKQQDKKEFDRIIDRMIRQYQYRLEIDRATGTDEKLLKKWKRMFDF